MSDAVDSDSSLWPIYIITLPQETERRANCKAQMKALGLPFTFFEAVEGAKLSASELAGVYNAELNKKLFKRPMSSAEIGCYLSHRSLWKIIGDSKFPGAVILEDDFDADDALPQTLQALAHIDLSNRLVKLHSEKLVSGRLLEDLGGGYQLVEPRSVPGNALGYVVSRTAAANLAMKTLPFGRPVDMDLKHWWEFDISILMVRPPVLHIHRATASKSAIQLSRFATKPKGRMGRLVRFLRNIRYQLPYRVALFRALRKIQMRQARLTTNSDDSAQ